MTALESKLRKISNNLLAPDQLEKAFDEVAEDLLSRSALDKENVVMELLENNNTDVADIKRILGYNLKKYTSGLSLSKEPKVQVSDTTMLNMEPNARPQKTYIT